MMGYVLIDDCCYDRVIDDGGGDIDERRKRDGKREGEGTGERGRDEFGMSEKGYGRDLRGEDKEREVQNRSEEESKRNGVANKGEVGKQALNSEMSPSRGRGRNNRKKQWPEEENYRDQESFLPSRGGRGKGRYVHRRGKAYDK